MCADKKRKEFRDQDAFPYQAKAELITDKRVCRLNAGTPFISFKSSKYQILYTLLLQRGDNIQPPNPPLSKHIRPHGGSKQQRDKQGRHA